MEEQNQVEVITQKETRMKWLPFSLTWKRAWMIATVYMPFTCLLAFAGLGMGVYEAFARHGFDMLVLFIWTLVNIVLLLTIVVHTIIDLLIAHRWENGDWGRVFNNGPIGGMAVCIAFVLFFGLIFMAVPDSLGVSSFLLLLCLSSLTFLDIWVLNHMREEATR